MMDVVQRATFGGHVAQVNLLVLYLHLESGKKVNRDIRINTFKKKVPKNKSCFPCFTSKQTRMLKGDCKLFCAMADSENP